jgi:hypothetical protein
MLPPYGGRCSRHGQVCATPRERLLVHARHALLHGQSHQPVLQPDDVHQVHSFAVGVPVLGSAAGGKPVSRSTLYALEGSGDCPEALCKRLP